VLALGVVKYFDVIEHIPSGFLTIYIGFSMDTLVLEELEETLSHRVIMTIAASAHTGLKPVLPQQIQPIMVAIQVHMGGMKQHGLFGSPRMRGSLRDGRYHAAVTRL
jgi:hypothetical protein